ncbi:MAG: hypothetical protein IJS40_01875 [Synergistaceae bacterium]|nr:hypothetical protein [Synergistaceae bacterium]
MEEVKECATEQHRKRYFSSLRHVFIKWKLHTNHDIKIGDIFYQFNSLHRDYEWLPQKSYSLTQFYQVTGLRAKTFVRLRSIALKPLQKIRDGDDYDEPLYEVAPVPNEFQSGEFEVRAWQSPEGENKDYLVLKDIGLSVGMYYKYCLYTSKDYLYYHYYEGKKLTSSYLRPSKKYNVTQGVAYE